jgi:hypothetical protein
MDCSWTAHGVFMDCSWTAHGVLMECSWSLHGVFVECSWSLWSIHGLHEHSDMFGMNPDGVHQDFVDFFFTGL